MTRGIVVTGLLIALCAAPAARAQTSHPPPTSSGAANPFLGSTPRGTATAEPLALSLKDAITRGLQYNLGLLLQEEAVKFAHGARWHALEDLLPNVSGTVGEIRQIINLEAFGFKADPSVVGPFNVFDARASLSQPLIDMRALHNARAASAHERAEVRGVRTARDLVTLVAVNLYLETIAASSRVEAAHVQQQTADALFRQATDLKTAGLVAGIDVLRAQVEIQNQRHRAIRAENDLEKSKLQLARAIGLPAGQPLVLTEKIPYLPFTEVTVEATLEKALATRADYLAARDRLAAAEASRRAASDSLLPTLHLDADYGVIGQTASRAHQTFRVAATVRVPVFEAGRATTRRLEADAELKQRQAELEDFKGRVEFDVRTALLDLRAAGQQVEAAQATVALAGQELEQARDRFAAGVAGSLEITQAQEAVAAASDTHISALYAHNFAKAALAHAAGTVEESVMAYLGGR